MNDLDKLYEAQLELMTAAFNKGKAYFNMVIVGGYAAFFALWSFVGDLLSDVQRLWSALLIALSIIFFIVWEITQMFSYSRTLLSLAKLVESPQTFAARIHEHNRNEKQSGTKLALIWIVVFWVTVITAFAGAGILLYAFVLGLWQQYG